MSRYFNRIEKTYIAKAISIVVRSCLSITVLAIKFLKTFLAMKVGMSMVSGLMSFEDSRLAESLKARLASRRLL